MEKNGCYSHNAHTKHIDPKKCRAYITYDEIGPYLFI